MILEIETVDALAEWQRQSAPDETTRRSLAVGNAARVVVLVNGVAHVPAWVKIARAHEGSYEGTADATYGPVHAGMLFAFDWRHVIDWL